MLLLTDIINIRGHYARKKFYVIQLVTRVDSDHSSYDMIEWLEEQECMRLTIKRGKRCTGSADVMSIIKQFNHWRTRGKNAGCEQSVTRHKIL